MIDKQQAANFIAAGVGTSEIANALGCDESYVSQLRHDPEVIALVASSKSQLTAIDVQFDSTLRTAEQKALERIDKMLPFADLSKSLAAFRILNSARRRADGPAENTGVSVTVNLTLPAALAPRYVTNERAEIIEVEGRTMLSASPKSLETLLAARANKAASELPPGAIPAIEKAARTLGGLVVVPQRKEPRRSPFPISVDQL